MQDQAQAEAVASENDLVKKFARGEVGLEALSPETQAKLLDGKYEPETEDAGAPAGESVAEPEAQASDVGQEPEPAKQGEPAPAKPKEPRKKKTIEELRDLALERADKLNALEQEKRSHLHKMQTDPIYRAKWFQENNIPIQAEAPAPKPEIWNDDFHLQQAARVAELEARVAASEREKAMQTVYRQVENFARKLGHEFQAPLAEINQASELVEGSGKKGADRDKELVALGFDAEDVEMYAKMVEVQGLMIERKYPDMEVALFDWQRRNGGAPVVRQQAVGVVDAEAEDREKRRQRMEEVMGHPATLPTQRAMSADQGITPEYAAKWLQANGHRINDLSKEEQATWSRIKAITGLS